MRRILVSLLCALLFVCSIVGLKNVVAQQGGQAPVMVASSSLPPPPPILGE